MYKNYIIDDTFYKKLKLNSLPLSKNSFYPMYTMISLVRPAAFTRRVGVCEKRLDTSVSVHHSVALAMPVSSAISVCLAP